MPLEVEDLLECGQGLYTTMNRQLLTLPMDRAGLCLAFSFICYHNPLPSHSLLCTFPGLFSIPQKNTCIFALDLCICCVTCSHSMFSALCLLPRRVGSRLSMKECISVKMKLKLSHLQKVTLHLSFVVSLLLPQVS